MRGRCSHIHRMGVVKRQACTHPCTHDDGGGQDNENAAGLREISVFGVGARCMVATSGRTYGCVIGVLHQAGVHLVYNMMSKNARSWQVSGGARTLSKRVHARKMIALNGDAGNAEE